jgi:hypothetical protein
MPELRSHVGFRVATVATPHIDLIAFLQEGVQTH